MVRIFLSKKFWFSVQCLRQSTVHCLVSSIIALDFIFNSNLLCFFSRSIAFLSFGLGDPQLLTYSTGFGLACFGGIQIGLYLKYPDHFEVNPWNLTTNPVAMPTTAATNVQKTVSK